MAFLKVKKSEAKETNQAERYFVQVAQVHREELCPDDPPTGHEALMLVDNTGKGVIFGLSWNVDKYDSMPILGNFSNIRAFFGRQGFVEYDEVDEKTVKHILNPTPKTDKSTGNANVDFYIRSKIKPIVYDLAYKELGDSIYKRCCSHKENPPTFRLTNNNCLFFVKKILKEHGIELPLRVLPRQVHHAVTDRYAQRMLELNPKVKIDANELKKETIYYNRLHNGDNSSKKSLELTI